MCSHVENDALLSCIFFCNYLSKNVYSEFSFRRKNEVFGWDYVTSFHKTVKYFQNSQSKGVDLGFKPVLLILWIHDYIHKCNFICEFM